jgi:hypothetical protein
MGSVFALLVAMMLFITCSGFTLRSTARQGFSLTKAATSVTMQSLTANMNTAQSLVRLNAGLKKDEEEEFFESDVSCALLSRTVACTTFLFVLAYLLILINNQSNFFFPSSIESRSRSVYQLPWDSSGRYPYHLSLD